MTHPRQTKSSSGVFQPGALWQRAQATSAGALRSGALEPIETHTTDCEDQGVTFLIRVVSKVRHKPAGSEHLNPFLPYEESLHVGDASATHACILNKYNVVDLHLLIVTRAFEHQETALTHADFQALWRCLCEYDSLGFYNSGLLSGASQKHKHLQLVPLPLSATAEPERISLMSLLDRAFFPAGKISRITSLPFRHAFVRRNAAPSLDLQQRAAMSLADYRRLMQSVGAEVPEKSGQLVATPYNLLVTRSWMLLVPRVSECFGEISLNSLAFAGALLVRNAAQLGQLRSAGPFTALQSVTEH